MKKFLFSLFLIFGLVYLSFAERKSEITFNHINISGATRIQFADLNDSADFERIGNSDIKKIEADLAPYNLTLVSPIFISKNGTIMTQSIVVLTIGAGLLGYRKSKEASIIASRACASAFCRSRKRV